MSVLLALLAALTNAVSSVLQRQANRAEAASQAFGVSMLRHLVRRRAWLVGAGAMVIAFVLQAAALSVGALATVQPLLAAELPMTVVLAALMLHSPLRAVDWAATVGMTVGLALLLLALDPHDVSLSRLPHRVAALATVATVVAVAAVVGVALAAGAGQSRAALLGVAAGAGFGLTAGLMKFAVVAARDHGLLGLLAAWETWAVAVAGLASVLLLQAALSAGTLVAVQPGLTLTDPLVAVVWGATVTGEHVRSGAAPITVAVIGALIISVGAVWLARSHPVADDASKTAAGAHPS